MPMSNDEVGHLIARLSLNVEEFMAAKKKVDDELHKTHGLLEKLGEKAAHFGKEVGKDMANRLLGGLGFGGLAAGAAAATIGFIERSIEVAEKYEKAEIGLNATLAANFRDVEKTKKEYEEFAGVMDKTTTVTHLQTLQMLKMAESYRLTGDAAKTAVKEAAALAAGTGHDPEAMIRVTAAVNEGNLRMAMGYGRLIPQLRGIKDEEEWIVEYNRQITADMEAQNSLAGLSSERWKRAREEVDRMSISVGRVADKMLIITANWFQRHFGGEKEQKFSEVHLTQEAQATLKEYDEKMSRIRAKTQLGVAAAWDAADWVKEMTRDQDLIGVDPDRVRAQKIARRTAELRANPPQHELGESGPDFKARMAAWEEAVKKAEEAMTKLQNKSPLINYLKDLGKYVNDAAASWKSFRDQAEAVGKTAEEAKVAKMTRELEDLKNFSKDTGITLVGKDLKDYNDKVERATILLEKTKQEADDLTVRRYREELMTREEKLAREIARINRQSALTQEEKNDLIEIERNKILGVMAALQAANSAFSSANAARQFQDYFLRRGIPGEGGPRAGAKGWGAGAGREVDSGLKFGPEADLRPTPTGGGKGGGADVWNGDFFDTPNRGSAKGGKGVNDDVVQAIKDQTAALTDPANGVNFVFVDSGD